MIISNTVFIIYIYIYIYIYYQTTYLLTLKNISHSKSLIFMKQVKHHNGFIYYTK